MIGRGLEHTAALWPDIERAYGWVHRAAHVLGNAAGEAAAVVRRRFDGLVGAMARHRAGAGDLAGAVDHFRKVARSYRPGLFHCFCNGPLVVKLQSASIRRFRASARGRREAAT